MPRFWDRFRRYPELKTVIVNLKSGTSFRGVVWKNAGAFMVIRNTEMLQDQGNQARHAVDGEVLVLTSDIDFVQVVG